MELLWVSRKGELEDENREREEVEERVQLQLIKKKKEQEFEDDTREHERPSKAEVLTGCSLCLKLMLKRATR